MSEKPVKAKKTTPWIRRGVQIFFFVLVACIATAGILGERGISVPIIEGASLHAVCPFGGVVSFWSLATAGTLVKKVHESSVVLSVIALVLLVFFGPVICGWICPIGSLQEWIGKIGRRVFGKRYNAFIPRRVDRPLRYLRYLALIWVSYLTIATGKLFFQEYDPLLRALPILVRRGRPVGVHHPRRDGRPLHLRRTALLQVRLSLRGLPGHLQPLPDFRRQAGRVDLHRLQGLR